MSRSLQVAPRGLRALCKRGHVSLTIDALCMSHITYYLLHQQIAQNQLPCRALCLFIMQHNVCSTTLASAGAPAAAYAPTASASPSPGGCPPATKSQTRLQGELVHLSLHGSAVPAAVLSQAVQNFLFLVPGKCSWLGLACLQKLSAFASAGEPLPGSNATTPSAFVTPSPGMLR